MTIDSTQFREVMGQFATGVTVVTLPSEPPHGITVNAFASVSLDPPLVLVCLDHDTHSHDLLDSGTVGGFGVTVLAADQRHLGDHFARIDELDDDPFETEPTTTAESGAPLFTDGIAVIDCTVDAAHEAGDHTIYVGAVEHADILDEGADAVTYFRGEWGSISSS